MRAPCFKKLEKVHGSIFRRLRPYDSLEMLSGESGYLYRVRRGGVLVYVGRRQKTQHAAALSLLYRILEM